MSETMKVFVACALGAFIGTVVNLEANRYFWWVGLLVGGFVGYISYEFKKVMMAIPTAWRKARGWQPDREWWREYGRLVRTDFGIGNTLASFIVSLSLPLSEIAFSLYFYVFILAFWIALVSNPYLSKEEMRKMREGLKETEAANPFRFYFWLVPRWILKGSWWLTRKSPGFIKETIVFVAFIAVGATKFAVRFGKALFKEIHSDLRMLCGLDAAIGTVIGYFAGSAVIGAMAGGLWGALNFEILSIRVLKLVPIEKSLFR